MTSFVAWMLLASSLGLVKMLVLASVLGPAGFGDYVAYFSTGTLVASLISVGAVERTIKVYPRLWIDGQAAAIAVDAQRVATALALRVAGLLLAAMLVSAAFTSIRVEDLALTAGVATGTALLSLAASAFRAAGSKALLQTFQMQRGVITLVLSLALGWALGWRGAMAGDVLATIVTAVWSSRVLGQVIKDEMRGPATSRILPSNTPTEEGQGHRQLFLANLLVTGTQMADRAVVRVAAGPAIAGSYGLVMLLPQVAMMTVNVVVQYIGPLIIKFVHTGHRDQSRISQLRLQTLALGAFAAVLVVGALVAARLPVVGDLIARFAVSDVAWAVAGLVACGHITFVIEFHLIARDREPDVLRASAISALVFFGLYGALAAWGPSLEGFLAAAATAKGVQVVTLVAAHRRAKLAGGNR